jgi:hypothetical protein
MAEKILKEVLEQLKSMTPEEYAKLVEETEKEYEPFFRASGEKLEEFDKEKLCTKKKL